MGQERLLVMFLTDGTVFNTELILHDCSLTTSPCTVHSYDLSDKKKHKIEYSSGFYFEEVNINHDHIDLF